MSGDEWPVDGSEHGAASHRLVLPATRRDGKR